MFENVPEEICRIEQSVIMGYQDFHDIPTAYSLHQVGAERTKQVSLLTALRAPCHRYATDPRDKVYAVLGLVSDRSIDTVIPDYTQPVRAVYQTATFNIINAESNLDILQRAITKSRRSGLPSWCLDFSTGEWGELEERNLFYLFSHASQFRADRAMEIGLPSHDMSLGALTVTGVIFGTVATAQLTSTKMTRLQRNRARERRDSSAVLLASEALSSLRSDVADFAEDVELALVARLGEAESYDLLATGEIWRTVSAGRSLDPSVDGQTSLQGEVMDEKTYADGHWLVEKYIFGAWKDNNTTDLSFESPWQVLIPELKVPGLEAWALRRMLDMTLYLNKAAFFTTSNGYIGTGDRAIEPEDLVCILFGSKLPVILRPHRGSYRLVSFAYVSGIMQGEFLEDQARVERERETFRII